MHIETCIPARFGIVTANISKLLISGLRSIPACNFVIQFSYPVIMIGMTCELQATSEIATPKRKHTHTHIRIGFDYSIR